MHLRDQLAPVVAESVYYGFWYAAKLDALFAFIREAQKPVTGEVKLKLSELAVKSNAEVIFVEVGGTVGDYVNGVYLEACRELAYEEGEGAV